MATRSLAADRSAETKRALIPYFGRQYVHVRHGKGTAWGWIHAHVYIPRPNDCHCKELAESRAFNGFGYCEPCRQARDSARRVMDAAVFGVDFGTWYVDDGYNTKSRQFIGEVHFDSDLD